MLLFPFRSIMPRKKGRNAIPSSEGEEFDFNVSDSSSQAVAHVRSTGSNDRRPRAAPAGANREPTIVAPIAPTPPVVARTSETPIVAEVDIPLPSPIPTSGSSRAQDIHFFYCHRQIDNNGKMEKRNVCTLCL